MEDKKWISYLSRVKKGIGVILGISCGVEDEPKQRLLDTAFAMDEIVEEILDDMCKTTD